MLCVKRVGSFMAACVFSLSILTSFNSYAGVWQETNNSWSYIKDDGVYAKDELIMDSKGNLYYINDKGEMLVNSKDRQGNYYGADGLWVNRNALNANKFNADFEVLRSTGSVLFQDLNEAVGFLNYVTYVKLPVFTTGIQITPKEGKMELSVTINASLKEALNRRAELDGILNEMSQSCRRSTNIETVTEVANAVMRAYNYTLGYESIQEGLGTGKGQCSAYTQLFSNLCDRLGYEVETILCHMKFSRELHGLNRVKIDGVWHYYDITSADNYNNVVRGEFLGMNFDTINQYYVWDNGTK